MDEVDLSGLGDEELLRRIGQLGPSTLLVGVGREQIERLATEHNVLGGWLRVGGRKINEIWNNGQVSYRTPTVKKPKLTLGPCEVLTSPEEDFGVGEPRVTGEEA